jgi:DNA-directed RNA polymerase specialized sigma24 family protein
MNMVKDTPLYIMRTDRKYGIDAGLLKYAEIAIKHQVVNDFKRLERNTDIHSMVFNNGVSPELSDDDMVAWESDDSTEDKKTRVIRDVSSFKKFLETEDSHDLERMVKSCELTDEESTVVVNVDLGDVSIREMANELGKPIQKIHRIRQSALKKLRAGGVGPDVITMTASKIAERNKCSVSEMLSPRVYFGPAIIARAYFFDFLRTSGFSVSEISLRYGMSEDRVLSAINRASILSSSPSTLS